MQVTPSPRDSLISHYPSSSSRVRLTDITYDQALLQVMEEPPDIGPEEEGDKDCYDWEGNLPKQRVAMVVHRRHGIEVHALEKGGWMSMCWMDSRHKKGRTK